MPVYRIHHHYNSGSLTWMEGDEVALTEDEAAYYERDSPGLLGKPLRGEDASLDEFTLVNPPAIENRMVKRASARSKTKAKPGTAAARLEEERAKAAVVAEMKAKAREDAAGEGPLLEPTASKEPGPPRGQFAGFADRVGGPTDEGAMNTPGVPLAAPVIAETAADEPPLEQETSTPKKKP